MVHRELVSGRKRRLAAPNPTERAQAGTIEVMGRTTEGELPPEGVYEARRDVVERIDELAGDLIAVSHAIHDHPELGYEEHFAHEQFSRLITKAGLNVSEGAYGLDTAFEARGGTTGPALAVLCEYDALPGIGHACGHNIIGAAGVGAGLGAAVVAEKLGGQVRILGTPAEEGGGGKIRLINEGAFEGVDAALMVHPADADLTMMSSLAIQQVEVSYTGLAAHAAAAPEEGINALDGAVLGYLNVAALRQHIAPDERLHGVFTDGGQKANIVPERAAAFWMARSPSVEKLERLKIRLIQALQAGADAAGCEFRHSWIEPIYEEILDNAALLERYVANAATLGRQVLPPGEQRLVASTDLGNVSKVVPAIHPMIKVAPAGTPIHTSEFAEYAASPDGDRAVLEGAKAMALTIVDCWSDQRILVEAQAEFKARAVNSPDR